MGQFRSPHHQLDLEPTKPIGGLDQGPRWFPYFDATTTLAGVVSIERMWPC